MRPGTNRPTDRAERFKMIKQKAKASRGMPSLFVCVLHTQICPLTAKSPAHFLISEKPTASEVFCFSVIGQIFMGTRGPSLRRPAGLSPLHRRLSPPSFLAGCRRPGACPPLCGPLSPAPCDPSSSHLPGQSCPCLSPAGPTGQAGGRLRLQRRRLRQGRSLQASEGNSPGPPAGTDTASRWSGAGS